MGKIGSFGSIITFEVTSDKILTMKDIKRTVSGRWTDHKILGKKPKLEFNGPDSDSVTFTVILDANHGVRPLTTINKLEKAVANGTVAYLSIGGVPSPNKMCLQSMSEEWDCVWNKGELVRAKVNLTFTEYT